MVFQNYALYPHMTVFDNMAFGLKLRKLPKEEIKEKDSGAYYSHAFIRGYRLFCPSIYGKEGRITPNDSSAST